MRDGPLEDVSRETYGALETYAELTRKWTRRINLVSASSLAAIWTRHIEDSAQVFPHLPKSGHVLDIGSGGGFPGLVLAILARGQFRALRFTLVESDTRKCTFLRTVARELDLSATVKAARVEALPPQGADVMTARALASLPQLLAHGDRHLVEGGKALFLKGESASSEIDAARREFDFELARHASITHAEASLLEITRIRRV